jgi:hypothetical protein
MRTVAKWSLVVALGALLWAGCASAWSMERLSDGEMQTTRGSYQMFHACNKVANCYNHTCVPPDEPYGCHCVSFPYEEAGWDWVWGPYGEYEVTCICYITDIDCVQYGNCNKTRTACRD